MSWASLDEAPLHEAELPWLERFQQLKAEDAVIQSRRQQWLSDIERWLLGQDSQSPGGHEGDHLGDLAAAPAAALVDGSAALGADAAGSLRAESVLPVQEDPLRQKCAALAATEAQQVDLATLPAPWGDDVLLPKNLLSQFSLRGPDPSFGAMQCKCPEVEDPDPWPAAEAKPIGGDGEGEINVHVLMSKLRAVELQILNSEVVPSPAAAREQGGRITALISLAGSSGSGSAIGDGSSSSGGGPSVVSMHRVRRRQCWPSVASALEPQRSRGDMAVIPVTKDSRDFGLRQQPTLGNKPSGGWSGRCGPPRWNSACWWVALGCAFHPEGRAWLAWAVMGSVCLLHDLLLLPLEAAFGLPRAALRATVDSFVTCYWAADIFVNFRTGFLVGKRLETSPRRLAARYAGTRLALDALLVTADVAGQLLRGLGQDPRRSPVAWWYWTLRCARLLHLARAKRYLSVFDRLVGSDALALGASLCKLLLGLLAGAHLGACGWYALGRGAEGGWTATFLDAAASTSDCAAYPATLDCVGFWYAASWRWVLAQVNGSTDMERGRTGAEMAYAGVIAVAVPLLPSALLTSFITRALLDYGAPAFSAEREAARKRQLVQAYLKGHGVAAPLQRRVRRRVAAAVADDARPREWEAEEEVLGLLSGRLRMDLIHEVRMRTLAVHPLFRKLRAHFPRAARHLCLHVRPAVTRRDEVLFKEGDPCSRMFFVAGGSMRYALPQSEDCRALQGRSCSCREGEEPESSHSEEEIMRKRSRGHGERIVAGRWLCEAALWSEWVNQGRLEATSATGLLAIEASEFAQALGEFSAAFGAVSWYAGRFVEELDRRGRLTDLTDVLVTSGWVGD